MTPPPGGEGTGTRALRSCVPPPCAEATAAPVHVALGTRSLVGHSHGAGSHSRSSRGPGRHVSTARSSSGFRRVDLTQTWRRGISPSASGRGQGGGRPAAGRGPRVGPELGTGVAKARQMEQEGVGAGGPDRSSTLRCTQISGFRGVVSFREIGAGSAECRVPRSPRAPPRLPSACRNVLHL